MFLTILAWRLCCPQALPTLFLSCKGCLRWRHEGRVRHTTTAVASCLDVKQFHVERWRCCAFPQCLGICMRTAFVPPRRMFSVLLRCIWPSCVVILTQLQEGKRNEALSQVLWYFKYNRSAHSTNNVFVSVCRIGLLRFHPNRQLPSAQQAAHGIDQLVRANHVCCAQGDQPALVADLLRRGGHLLGQVRGEEGGGRYCCSDGERPGKTENGGPA